MSGYSEFVESLPKIELPEDLGVKVIEIPARTFGTRKVFINLPPEYVQFKQGQRVLPAEFVGIPDQGAVYFEKTHPPGTKHFSEGGHQCLTELGGRRTFFLDALMVHPNEFKKSKRIAVDGLRKRGRKANPNKIQKDENAPKGKRGRKPLDPEEKARREELKAAKLAANPDRKRGRPPIDPLLKKPIIMKDPNAPKGQRGRPALSPEEKAAREIEKLAKTKITGGKRGRPKKIKIDDKDIFR